MIGEAIATRQTVAGIVAVEPDGINATKRILVQTDSHTIPLYHTDKAAFARLSDTVHSAGVVAVVDWAPRTIADLADALPRRMLFCDRISDPGNLGTLIRTAAGLGLDGVVVSPSSAEVANPKVVRSTAGALFRIPVYADIAVADFLSLCRQWGVHIVLADPQGDEDIDELASNGWAAVVGGETAGLDAAWPSTGVSRLKITMHHGVESLNASVAGALLIDRLCHKAGTPD
ncbi:MAG: hypothetical protein Kow0074_20470 [Candidatus Zixiibacteriota bacterium]